MDLNNPDPQSPPSAWQQLEEILGEETREQLAGLLLSCLGEGWGELLVVCRSHRIDRYQVRRSLLASRRRRDVKNGAST